MVVETKNIKFATQEEMSIVDITHDAANLISESSIKNGIVTIFVPGSTGALTTIEYEPGLVQDLKDWFEKNVSKEHTYHHEERWHDGNGHSHVRAALIGPSISIPFNDNRFMLGTWQQIVFIDFDIRGRERELIVQLIGD